MITSLGMIPKVDGVIHINSYELLEETMQVTEKSQESYRRIHSGENGKVTLWTRQDARSLEIYKAEGRVRIEGEHLKMKFTEISGYIMELYDWFVKAAEKVVPKPEGVSYPVWCAISEDNMLRPTETEVVYVLEVDPEEVIYFDGLKWDLVLNHHYIPKDEKDREAYMRDMAAKGYDNTFSFINGKTAHMFPLEKKRIMDSWPRIFEIDDWNIFAVQANIWEIRKDMVKCVLGKDMEVIL